MATNMVDNGTDILSSTTSLMGSDSTRVATKETKATIATAFPQSKLIHPKAEK